MTKTETVASKLRFALQQIDSLPPNSGVTPEQLHFIRETLTVYLEQVEKNLEFIPPSDLILASRLVIEYWPISLLAGEAVIAAEQAMRKLAGK
ncbi:hypothetical protein ABIB38_003784 [Massilia sp. UYP11]|uniref:hypothetical protein n=1 Tax=Massilia sp. UYP11 TaxID=1756385 RepID=UPI003D1AA946